MKEIRLKLVNEKGQTDTFTEDRIPMQKLIDCLELQDAFEKNEIETNVDGVMKKIEFVASCFRDERVTAKAILKGLDAREFEDEIENIINVVLGVDEETKKSQTEKP